MIGPNDDIVKGLFFMKHLLWVYNETLQMGTYNIFSEKQLNDI